ncbi:tRNA 2-thiouridine(34) synthase MnmA [Candidatus Saccharibacteria bacterium]|nr:tRNA 2-thiouridine(34) synthase MnmA [Candidatus Saccharibacteria bacterium]
MAKRVYVGLSGGVDSSVTAALLKQQGYDVVGVYMKNWSQDLPGFTCPWKEDYQDAKRVAVQLGIPFKLFDFEKEYRQKVVDYMVAEYQAGRTPNPDIMCNQEVKFKLFLDAALADGADMIATGHYARATDGELHMAKDDNKDQTYFLYRVTKDALQKTLFPLGDYTKPEVRKLAQKFGLVTAQKKESMGICFVGKVGIKEFLLHELGPQQPGDIIDNAGVTVGWHEGAIFYTIGQRHGLDVGGGLPYYVSGKDMAKNEVYVTRDLDDEKLWRRSCRLSDVHFIGEAPIDTFATKVRCRHRGELLEASFAPNDQELVFAEDVRGLSPGQSAVFYDGVNCLGGGVIN